MQVEFTPERYVSGRKFSLLWIDVRINIRIKGRTQNTFRNNENVINLTDADNQIDHPKQEAKGSRHSPGRLWSTEFSANGESSNYQNRDAREATYEEDDD